MNIMLFISNIIIPFTIVAVVLFGFSKNLDVYDIFVDGAKDGIMTVFTILPTLIGLMMAVAVLRASGVMDLIVTIIKPITDIFGFPAEILPLSAMRLFSSSAATGMLTDLFATFGPDSFIGRVASVMMSCTETVFYTMSVYFMSVNIKNTRYTLAGALISNITGIIVSFLVVTLMFGN